MARIDGFRVKNYRALRDVTLGKLWNTPKVKPLSPMTVVIGKNGVGKSTLFDAFGFLSDCLRFGVEEACDRSGRGGFERLRTQGVTGPIEFEIYYKENGKNRPITYELTIDMDGSDRPYVVYERLRQRRKGQNHGRPFSFLILSDGRGVAWKGHTDGTKDDADRAQLDLPGLLARLKTQASQDDESAATEFVELDDPRRLGIATLGSPAVVVVVDLDHRVCEEFKREMVEVLAACEPAPKTLVRIAIEEMEAWLLGDRNAVITAYPHASKKTLDTYHQDSICGTWELLADAVHTGGAKALKHEGWPAPGRAKCEWARNIAPHVDIETNHSKSFLVFRDGIRALAT